MDIRLLDKNDIGEAKALWKSSFGDSKKYIDTYFENKIELGNSLGLFEEGLACVVHMLPYKIRVQGRVLQSSYIAGAATAEQKRNRGLMRIMLLESLKLMKQRGILLTHLYPFKHSFYEKFGWTTYSYVQKNTETNGKKAQVRQTRDINLLHALYQNMMQKFDGYVIRSETEWKWRLSELFCDGGRAAVLLEDETPVAYMLYYGEGTKAKVIETVFEEPKYAKKLGQHIASEYSEVFYNTPSQDYNNTAQGMARIVDAESFLQEFGAHEALNHASITDGFANWNNIGNAATQIDVRLLAKIAHMGLKHCCSDANFDKKLYNILNEKFVPRYTCIFEEY